MVNSKNNSGNQNSLNLNIGAITKNSEMIGFFPSHLKLKNVVKM